MTLLKTLLGHGKRSDSNILKYALGVLVAITPMQIIQSLSEAMSWFERELQFNLHIKNAFK
jgi:hypothetical protein